MKVSFYHWYNKLLNAMLILLGFSASAGFTACMYGMVLSMGLIRIIWK